MVYILVDPLPCVHVVDDPLPHTLLFPYLSQTLDSGLSWEEELECALKALATLLRDEKTISWYEVHMSRLVPVLLYCLTGQTRGGGEGEEEGAELAAAGMGPEEAGPRDGRKAEKRVKLFRKMFVEASDEHPPDLDSR